MGIENCKRRNGKFYASLGSMARLLTSVLYIAKPHTRSFKPISIVHPVFASSLGHVIAE